MKPYQLFSKILILLFNYDFFYLFSQQTAKTNNEDGMKEDADESIVILSEKNTTRPVDKQDRKRRHSSR